uniref:Uncharacterized protein n=1 Tax=Panagrolaimus sp. PS1159 TaxID=55785 RepID=A0AC35FRU1_9BILA
MSCLFCGSNLHLSHFCDIYKSDISRTTAARSKKLCCKCFREIGIIKPIITNHSEICLSYQRCHICYSNSHHTFLCNKKETQLLFIPKLDKVLLQRFMRTFDPVEQIQFGFYYNSGNLHLPYSQILNKPTTEYKNLFPPTSTVIYNFPTFVEIGRNFLDKIKLNTRFTNSQFITLKNVELSSYEFLSLLSLNTIELNCNNVTITIDDMDFDMEALTLFMKEKANFNLEIFLNIEIQYADFQEINLIIKEKFEKYFKKKRMNESRWICVRFFERDEEDMSKIVHSLGTYTLK